MALSPSFTEIDAFPGKLPVELSEVVEGFFSPSAHDDAYRDAVLSAEIAPGERILDVHTGRGRMLRHLRPVLPSKQARYTGLGAPSDLVPTRKIAHRFGLGRFVELVPCTTLALPVASRSADAAFIHFTLHALGGGDRRIELLREAARVLSAGGRLMIVEPSDRFDARNVVDLSSVRDEQLRHLPRSIHSLRRSLGYGLLRRAEEQIGARLRSGALQGYSSEGLAVDLLAAGLRLQHARETADASVIVARAIRA